MKIGIYCRVSGISQRENTSLENQKALGIEFCKRSNYQYEVFTDVESGGKINRKIFSQLITKCEIGNIGGIWVYDNDRLSRDYDVGGEIRQIIVKHKLRLFVGWEEVKLEESKDRFNYNIRSVMSDYERIRINERFDYGKQRSYQNGRGLGMMGFGYSKDRNKNVIINEEESKIVVDIYKTYLRKDVESYSDVFKRILNKYGKVVNGKRITESRISKILRDDKYLGKVYRKDFEGNVYEFNIGRIISDDLKEKVLKKQSFIKGRRKNNIKNNYLLKGKVSCGCYGGNMWVKRGGKKHNKTKSSYYYCNNHHQMLHNDYQSIEQYPLIEYHHHVY